MKVPKQYMPILQQASQRTGMPLDLLIAQIANESSFNSKARGYNKNPNGSVDSVDRGIAQINNKWHPEISNVQADDPQFAINWMADNMSAKYKQYGDWGAALSAYNTGNPHAGFYNGYVKKIMSNANNYEQVDKVGDPLKTIANAQPQSAQKSFTGGVPLANVQPTTINTPTDTNQGFDLGSIINTIGKTVTGNNQKDSYISPLAQGGQTTLNDQNTPSPTPQQNNAQQMQQNSPFAGKIPTPHAAAANKILGVGWGP